MLPVFVLCIIAAVIIGLIAGKPFWQRRKRAQITSKAFPKAWRSIIQKRVPYFRKMPSDLQLQLKKHIQVFLAEKKFIGCNGVVINDDIRVTIAAQACLLLLNRKTDFYPKLKRILVYPRAFVKSHQSANPDGVHFFQNSILAGESWEQGTVVLSWQDTISGAHLPDDGHNVVIHEFAHQLDQENGSANGAPRLARNQSLRKWADVLSEEFAILNTQMANGEPSIFDYYGASNPAEFFAVASEVFFEKPHDLKRFHPKLYEQLSAYYMVNPVIW
uniref:M90 family metallopeptidase n=1 Tax=Ningiella ruwaisensis TaxID=2364274 RepID=UPI00109EF164|nr:M90 family metallopeptidase [Ningiella ruwaisensis]